MLLRFFLVIVITIANECLPLSSVVFSFVLERYPFIVIALHVSLSQCTLRQFISPPLTNISLLLASACCIWNWHCCCRCQPIWLLMHIAAIRMLYMVMFFDAFNSSVVIFTLTTTLFWAPRFFLTSGTAFSIRSHSHRRSHCRWCFKTSFHQSKLPKCLSIHNLQRVRTLTSEFIEG